MGSYRNDWKEKSERDIFKKSSFRSLSRNLKNYESISYLRIYTYPYRDEFYKLLWGKDFFFSDSTSQVYRNQMFIP